MQQPQLQVNRPPEAAREQTVPPETVIVSSELSNSRPETAFNLRLLK